MRTKPLVLLLFASILMIGCEYAFSDVATRVRYALGRANLRMRITGKETLTITVDPDHRPDGCREHSGYKLSLIPYKGGKVVPVGDIEVRCGDGHPYSTGFGSEKIYVASEMAVEKKSGEEVQITLHKTPKGVDVVDLK